MNIVKSTEVRVARNVRYVRPTTARAVAGVTGGPTVRCTAVKVYQLVKGGYSVHFLGSGVPAIHCNGTDTLVMVNATDDSFGEYLSSLFSE